MLIREVKKQAKGCIVDWEGFEGTVKHCSSPILTKGEWLQDVDLTDSSGHIWTTLNHHHKRTPVRNGTVIIVNEFRVEKGASEGSVRVVALRFTIPTTSEPPSGSCYEYNPAHPADEMTKDDWAAKDERMARMCSLNNATALVVCIAEISNNPKVAFEISHVKDTACKLLDWIYETQTRKEQQ